MIPEYRINAKLVHLLSQNHEIVAQNFAHGFVFHGGIRSAAEAVAELTLNHAEGGFDIGALVVVLRAGLIAAHYVQGRGSQGGWVLLAVFDTV